MEDEKNENFNIDKMPDDAPNLGITSSHIEANTFAFHINDGPTEVLKFCENGDIFIQGRLAENDNDVVEGMRKFLKSMKTTKEELAEQFLMWAEKGWNLKGAYDDNQKEGQESTSWEIVRPYYKRKLVELF